MDRETQICCAVWGRALLQNKNSLEQNACCVFPQGKIVLIDRNTQGCCYQELTFTGSDSSYNLSTEICCKDGQVYSKDTYDKCCGEVYPYLPLRPIPYHSESKVCCQARLFDNVFGELAACCYSFYGDTWVNARGQPYNLGEQLCCYPNITTDMQHGPADFHYYSHAGIIVNKGEETPDLCCLTGTQISHTSASVWHPMPYENCGIEQQQPNSNDEICMDYVINRPKFYNTESEICCDRYILNKEYGEATACCPPNRLYTVPQREEMVLYDSNEQVCCWSDSLRSAVVLNKSDEHQACCGRHLGSVYNRTSHACQDGRVVERPAEEECNGVTYSTLTQFCCDDTYVHDRGVNNSCCGSQAFNRNRHLCCGGKYVHSRGDNTSCCGNSLYNPHVHQCCEGHVHTRMGSQWSCCSLDYYHTGTRVCCGGGVYSKQSHLCCGTSAYPTDTGHDACCGDLPYNSALYKCGGQSTTLCHGPHSYEYSMDIGVWYDESIEMCCNGVVYENTTSSAYNGCCGHDASLQQPYHSSNTRCTSGGWLTPLCGDEPYDETRTVCCQGRVCSIRHDLGETGCCGQTCYNTDNLQCCDNTTLISKYDLCFNV